MRPIFEKERLMLNEKLGLDLPQYSWMNRMIVYSNGEKYIRFTANEDEIKITKDHRKEGINYYDVPFLEQSLKRKLNIEELEKESIQFIIDTVDKLKEGRKVIVSYSGGKDSDVVYDLVKKSNIYYEVLVSDTSNEMPETYKRWMTMQKEYGDRFHWTKPKTGMYKYFKEKNFIPTQTSRACCTDFKKAPLKKFINNTQIPLLNFNGVRWDESITRSKRERISENPLYGKIEDVYKNTEVMPIIAWTEQNVWDYIFLNNLPYNDAYEYGFSRVGCRICPYMSNYTLKIVEEHTPATHRTYQKLLDRTWEANNYDKLKFTQLMNDGHSDEYIMQEMNLSSRKFSTLKTRYLNGEREMFVGKEEYMKGKWRG